jgi:O-antigen ligase
MIGILGGVSLLLMSQFVSMKWLVGFLILISPFPLIKTQYGTINMIIVYVVGFTFFMLNRYKEYPLKVPFAIIFFAYLLSMTQVEQVLIKGNAVFLFSFFSSFVLFYIVYNYIITTQDAKFVIKMLVVVNMLICIYCVMQLFFGDYPLFEFLLKRNREDRLSGPYIVGLTAEYFAIQSIFLLYLIMSNSFPKWNKYMYAILFFNFSFLIATGNRGGFLVLLGGLFLFILFFRKVFNFKKILFFICIIGFVFTFASLFVLQNTKYNVLFDRLGKTEIRGGVPDSRSNPWPQSWDAFLKKPLIGHGPRIGFEPGAPTKSSTDLTFYPHNLYLYVLVTTGAFGLFAFLNLFIFIFLYIYRGKKRETDHQFLKNLPTLFIILFIMFIIDQLKIEFLRFHVNEYQHYMFILFALFIGVSNILHKSEVIGAEQ